MLVHKMRGTTTAHDPGHCGAVSFARGWQITIIGTNRSTLDSPQRENPHGAMVLRVVGRAAAAPWPPRQRSDHERGQMATGRGDPGLVPRRRPDPPAAGAPG